MSTLLLSAPAKKDPLKEIVADSNGLRVIDDLDPDNDLVRAKADLTELAASGDCVLQLPADKRNLNVIGGPHLVSKRDNGGAIEELLEKLARPMIEPPKKGKFTKEYLFIVLTNHCNMIVDDRIIYVRKPMQRHHTSLPDPVQLQVFLKELLEESGTADGRTLRKQITLRKCKALYNLCITDFKAIAKAEKFKNDGNYLAVANGIIHVVGGKIELLQYDEHPELCFKHTVNANYNPEAEGLTWQGFLSDYIGNNQKDIDRYWEAEGNLP